MNAAPRVTLTLTLMNAAASSERHHMLDGNSIKMR